MDITPIIPIPGFSEPFSTWTHFLAAGASVVGGIFLIKKGWGNALRVLSLLVFIGSLIFLFSMSGVYHLLEPGYLPRAVFKRLDHAAIWVLIAGTFTPMHIILFRGFWRWGVLSIIWALAITGLVLKTVFFNEMPEWAGVTLYVGLGWMGVLSSLKISALYGFKNVKLIFLGGIFYTVGAVLEFIRWPELISGVVGPHEVFHLFVILGALSHGIFIYKWSHSPIKDKFIYIVKEHPGQMFYAKAKGENIYITANSLDALHSEIKVKTFDIYHKNRGPESIRLTYHKEEIL